MIEYTLKTKRLGLRNWQKSDVVPLSEMNKNEEVMRYFPSTVNEKATTDFIERMHLHFQENGFCYFAADRLDTGVFIGFIGILYQNYLEEPSRFVDIGWRLHPSAWGLGFATEGAKACLEFGLNTLGLEEIYAVAPAINLNSEKVMKKIGMQKMKNFDHPKLLNDQRLRNCVLYKAKI